MTSAEADNADPGSVDAEARAELLGLLQAIHPWDARETADLARVADWIASGAPLYRGREPDLPAQHLVSYFVVLDQPRNQLLLVAHRKAGLWLPTGGHVEPYESPWDAVARECLEELHVPATPSTSFGRRPCFLTVNGARGAHPHTDVSLWFTVAAAREDITRYDTGEFEAIAWLTPQQVLQRPIETLDPHMHRFTRKLVSLLG
ncbi:MAG: NUDIX hydrolase [Micromonosporaceae bacterium]